MKYVMALDQGTTSSRCILFDHSERVCAVTNREFRQIFPKPGWRKAVRCALMWGEEA